jgi:hypothetical protein
MSKAALHGKRDIIVSPKRIKPLKIQKIEPNDEETSSSSEASSSLVDLAQLETVLQMTALDMELRKRKLRRFESISGARRLTCTVLNRTVCL